MPFVNGQVIDEDDYINFAEKNVTPSNDVDKAIKAEADGRIHPFFLRNPLLTDGSDGNLIISSGTTTIDCAGAALVVRNYNELSITGTASLAFSNPNANGTTIILLCNKFVCTSSATRAIDTRNMGAAGGAAQTTTANNTTLNGNNGTASIGFSIHQVNAGIASTDGTGSVPGGGGTLAAGPSLSTVRSLFTGLLPYLMPGAGGASGLLRTFSNGGATVTSGVGGRGGGALAILCSGEWNFTGTIDTSGQDGGSGSGSGPDWGANGGGGGGAGTFMGIYTQLIANSGTVNANGGVGGNRSRDGSTVGAGSGGGASLKQAGNAGTGNVATGKNGGDGGPGYVLRTRNTGTFT